MTQADLNATRARVIRVVAEILEVDESAVTGSSRMREDLGMDSLASLELLSTLSEELEVDLELEEALGVTTVDEVCAFVEKCRTGGRTRVRRAAHAS